MCYTFHDVRHHECECEYQRGERKQNKNKTKKTKEKSVLSRTRERSAKSDPLPQRETVQEGVLYGGQADSNTVIAITSTIVVMAAVIRDHVQYAPRSDSFRFLHDLRS